MQPFESMWRQIKSYLKFLLKSKNHHGVHSPFVYGLVTQCFYADTDREAYQNIKAYRNALLEKTGSIAVTDFGSGSQTFTSRDRSIRRITKVSGTPLKRLALLYQLVAYLKPQHLLELGTSLGNATHAMALAAPDSHITTIEGCPEIAAVAERQLQTFEIANVALHCGRFADVLPTLGPPRFDLVFFDGHHEKHATLQYFEQLLPKAHNDTVFIFDDIHWSKGMEAAWDTIKNHPRVTVTIDTFYWGFVFLRTEQAKEHFTIRL